MIRNRLHGFTLSLWGGRPFHQPHGPAFVIDAIPEPSTSCDPVLPLLHRLTRDVTRSQVTPKRVLRLSPRSRIVGQFLPYNPGVRRSSRANLFPPDDGSTGPISEIPPRCSRRRRNSFSTLRQRSSLRWSINRPAIGHFDRGTESLGRSGLSVDLCRCFPLPHQLGEPLIGFHPRRRNQRP